MAEQLTEQQKQAVEDRGGQLLVSAAAGSGKTKVLVDRLMRSLTDPTDPADIDEFLIITYTKAAAAELRGKIAAKLSQRMAEEPENRHLQRQFQRLFLTQISTVHSFCSVVLKEFSYLTDLPADFRVADENECAELRLKAVTAVLEKAYAAADADFCAFADAQGLGRDDRRIPQIVLKVYDSARCNLRPKQWLRHCLQCAETQDGIDALQTPYGQALGAALFDWLDRRIAVMERCAAAAAQTAGWEKPAANLADTVQQLHSLRESTTWDEIVRRKQVDFGTLRIPTKCGDAEVAQQIKAVRDACKEELKKQTACFADSSEAVLRDLGGSASSVRGLIALVEQFDAEYTKMKRNRRILDFGDLEHETLDLLYGKSRSGITAAAVQIGHRYREVMVDEYQDSNAVQDEIYAALTQKKQNLFMVGDVKQSIYQFRLADPEIFLKKYRDYVPAEKAQPGMGRKVMLNRNFRSGKAILSAVNDVFSLCMSPQVGGLHYGEEEALNGGEGLPALDDPQVGLYLVQVREDTYAEEAAFVAQKIEQLLEQGVTVRDGAQTRAVTPGDIVILLRSPGSSGMYYRDALLARGIRCASGGAEDLLQTPQIATLCALLQVIQNPLSDIPLLAVLASPVFGFTADDLAAIRAADRDHALYRAMQCDAGEKSVAFVQLMTKLRTIARLQPLTVLLEQILALTGLDCIYAAGADGEKRAQELQTFLQMAAAFEATGKSDAGRFLEHLQMISERGLTAPADSAGDDCVTIMSIHKSKGLEFPVVFLCGLSRGFNTEDRRAAVLCHREMGLGLSAVEHTRRLRYPTIAKNAIAARMAHDSVSEELRVLYVAMTRAKDRLFMTYATQRAEKELSELVLRLNMGDLEELTGRVSCPGTWVLLTALHRTEAGALFALGGKPKQTHIGDTVWQIEAVSAPTVTQTIAEQTTRRESPAPQQIGQLAQMLSFSYPHSPATTAPSKQTATQRKGREKDDEAAEFAPRAHTPFVWRQPTFVQAGKSGTEYGNAIHAAMQFVDFAACTDAAHIRAELDRLIRCHLLTSEEGALVDPNRLNTFFQTPLGQKLRTADNVIREFKFSVLDDAAQYDAACAGEKILLQGVVDCALVEDDGITIVDFKTDFVTSETLPAVAARYRAQVQTYADALQRIYAKPVKEKLLYFFHIGRFARC